MHRRSAPSSFAFCASQTRTGCARAAASRRSPLGDGAAAGAQADRERDVPGGLREILILIVLTLRKRVSEERSDRADRCRRRVRDSMSTTVDCLSRSDEVLRAAAPTDPELEHRRLSFMARA